MMAEAKSPVRRIGGGFVSGNAGTAAHANIVIQSVAPSPLSTADLGKSSLDNVTS